MEQVSAHTPLADFANDAAYDHSQEGKVTCVPTEALNSKKIQQDAVQWQLLPDDAYCLAATTCETLPAGCYTVRWSDSGPIFQKKEILLDALIHFPDSLQEATLREISEFWNRGPIFKQYGFLHRRGYLFYGPQGCGKSILVQQIVGEIIKQNDICLFPTCDIAAFGESLVRLRKVEPNRKLVCVYEDIDAIIGRRGEDGLLALLDGDGQIDRVLNIATTNYPERLPKRVVSRPRRFDRVIKMCMPNAKTRELYLKKKLGIADTELNKWVNASDGFSFAALAELVIGVKCLGNSFEAVVLTLRNLMIHDPSSDEYAHPRKAPFGLTKNLIDPDSWKNEINKSPSPCGTKSV